MVVAGCGQMYREPALRLRYHCNVQDEEEEPERREAGGTREERSELVFTIIITVKDAEKKPEQSGTVKI